MMTTVEQIDLWRNAPTETQTLEFKEAKASFDREKLARYCIAIANEGGGQLLLGITDTPPRKVVGSSAFPNPIATEAELFTAVGFRVDVEAVDHPDGRVVIFHIPSRPKGAAYNFKGSYLMRSGESLVPMSEDRLRKIFAEGGPEWLDEPTKKGLDEQEVVDLLDTQAFFELLKLPYPSTRAGVLERLLSEQLIDEADGGYSIRRCGGLLLAKRLRNFPDLARKAPRVVVYSGNNKLETRIDQTGDRGYAAGFQGLVAFVMGQLPQNEVIKNALRQSITLLPEDAIRELIANALIHQDFTTTGVGPMIEIYANRVEISNPGEPIVPVERFIDGYSSRNERLTDLMRRMDICEERSSGVDRVVHTVEVYQLPAPEFRADLGRTTVVVHGVRDFEEMTRDDRIRACYQHCVLKWVMRERMTNETLRQRFGLGPSKASTASQIISITGEAGLIKADQSVGASKKYARYLPHWA
ncbi:ATP-binding protein [Stappia sp. ICDLI1TA098]